MTDSSNSRPERHRVELVNYLKTMSVEDQRAFAEKAGTTHGQIKQIAYGNRSCNPTYALAIDKLSKGAVPAPILCPEFDWAYAGKIGRRMSK